MCRNIRTLFNFDPPANEEEVRGASLVFVREITGFNRPSKANEAAFNRAIEDISNAARSLLDSLVTSSEPRNREVEAQRAHGHQRHCRDPDSLRASIRRPVPHLDIAEALEGHGMTRAIETSGLVKTFGPTRAADGIDLAIERGSVYGLLGPNGAGKTTTIRTLATLLRPDAGTAKVLGIDVALDPAAVRSRVSLTGQFASVDEDLTGLENLILVGRLLGLSWSGSRERARDLLDAFGLAEAAKRLVRTYSGGQRRRLDIAASLIVTPEVLFLDEPTSSLDPRSRNQVWDIIRAIAAKGTTVLLSDAVPRGGGPPRGPPGRHRPWPTHRGGHERRSEGVRGREPSARSPAEPGAESRGRDPPWSTPGNRSPQRGRSVPPVRERVR